MDSFLSDCLVIHELASFKLGRLAEGEVKHFSYLIDNEFFVVQINQVNNASFMNPSEFPEHLQRLLERMKEDDENQKIVDEKEKNTCSIQLYCHHPKRGRIDVPLKVAATDQEGWKCAMSRRGCLDSRRY